MTERMEVSAADSQDPSAEANKVAVQEPEPNRLFEPGELEGPTEAELHELVQGFRVEQETAKHGARQEWQDRADEPLPTHDHEVSLDLKVHGCSRGQISLAGISRTGRHPTSESIITIQLYVPFYATVEVDALIADPETGGYDSLSL